MPTENPSSNTKVVSVPRGLIEQLEQFGEGSTPGRTVRKDALEQLYASCTEPAPQPHPDPIAWMVGTAFWWTKEEAERDAAETGLPIFGLGPMACAAHAEQHQGVPVAFEIEVSGYTTLLARTKDKADKTAAHYRELGHTVGIGPLYTHADRAEVESLKADKQAFAQNAVDLRAEVERLRAACEAEFRSVEVLNEANQKLQAQLAEAQALLRTQDDLLSQAYQHDIGTTLKREICAAALPTSAETQVKS